MMPLHQINRKDDSSQLCFRCRFGKPALLLQLVFSEVVLCCGLSGLPVVVVGQGSRFFQRMTKGTSGDEVGDLGKKVHACSLRFSALNGQPLFVWLSRD